MSNQEIRLPRHLVNQLLHYAQSSPDAEVCGLVGAKDGLPATCYPVKNMASQPDCRFALDPGEQSEAIRRMRDRGEEFFAVFHSHPATPAEPSAADLEQASYPEALYLIISLNTKGVLELRGFRIGVNREVSEAVLLLEQG
jgi:proteasome lid subunit RPN8/RPN11